MSKRAEGKSNENMYESNGSRYKNDLDRPKAIELFVDNFYGRIKKDARLAEVFFDFGAVNLEQHLPHIRNYWKKLLLSDPSYRRHTMNIHRKLHKKVILQPSDFDRWLALFDETVDDGFSGPLAERAKTLARNIADNMRSGLKIGAD